MVLVIQTSINQLNVKIDILNGSLFTLDTLNLRKKPLLMFNGIILETDSNLPISIITMPLDSLSLLEKILIMTLGMEKLPTSELILVKELIEKKMILNKLMMHSDLIQEKKI